MAMKLMKMMKMTMMKIKVLNADDKFYVNPEETWNLMLCERKMVRAGVMKVIVESENCSKRCS